VARPNPRAQWEIVPVPSLRIVSAGLWEAVKARQTVMRESDGVRKARASRFWEQRRSQHLLTGLVYCGSCGSRLAAVGRDYLACSAARGRGTCANRRGIRRGPLEELILDGLRQRLMAPELVEEFVAAFHEEVNRLRRDETAARAGKERELAEVRRKLDGLIDAVAEGLRGPGLQQRLDGLEARKANLEQELSADPPPPVRLHPNLAQLYRRQVEQLQLALQEPSIRDEALGDPARADRAHGGAWPGRKAGRAPCGGGLFGEGGCGGSQPPTVSAAPVTDLSTVCGSEPTVRIALPPPVSSVGTFFFLRL
jgi:hypothetical protein